MAIDRKGAVLTMYRKELLHMEAFAEFARIEADPKIRRLLSELAVVERGHAQTYLKAAAQNSPKGYSKADLYVLLISRRILGLGLTMKVMERTEHQLESKLRNHFESKSFPRIDERREDSLKSEIIGYNKVLGNIRDIFFGMSDGLVEILAAVSGIGAALQQPLLILIAGSIVAVSGTLSMAGGAYLSTDYENIVGESRKTGYEIKSPSKSAAYVGIAYIFGSLFPLLPFILGMSGVAAIGSAVLVTAIVLAFTSTLISIVSDTPILKRVTKTLVITLGIAAITITLGLFARYYLHVTI